MLGLQDERMSSVVKERWATWVAIEPRLVGAAALPDRAG
jgi:hypothetical protein